MFLHILILYCTMVYISWRTGHKRVSSSVLGLKSSTWWIGDWCVLCIWWRRIRSFNSRNIGNFISKSINWFFLKVKNWCWWYSNSVSLLLYIVDYTFIRSTRVVQRLHREVKRDGWRRENQVHFSKQPLHCGIREQWHFQHILFVPCQTTAIWFSYICWFDALLSF